MPIDRAVPPFYCVYLLRSLRTPASLYIGSTPDPRRRLRQHNGHGKSGAHRTVRARPWEMALLVKGFPSKIAALQFEWAWQNTHMTRHIPEHQRITQLRHRQSRRTGRTLPSKPPAGKFDKLMNLHLLLRVQAFTRWPLEVQFLSKSLYDEWRKWTDDSIEKLRPSVTVSLYESEAPLTNSQVISGMKNEESKLYQENAKAAEALARVSTVDPTYNSVESYVEKSTTLLEDFMERKCVVCGVKLDPDVLVTVCPYDKCEMTAHVSCLGREFLEQERQPDSLLPTKGTCPSCNSTLKWSELMKNLTLRFRGQDEIEKLLKRKQRRLKKESQGPSRDKNDVDAFHDLYDDEDEFDCNDNHDSGDDYDENNDYDYDYDEDDNHNYRQDKAQILSQVEVEPSNIGQSRNRKTISSTAKSESDDLPEITKKDFLPDVMRKFPQVIADSEWDELEEVGD